jgi:TPR repeat protein
MIAVNIEESSFVSRLSEFIEALGRRGITVTVEQRVRLAGFLAQLSAGNMLPSDPEPISNIVTPLIALTPQEQTTCRDLISEFVSQTRPVPLPNIEVSGPSEHTAQRSWRLQVALAHVGLLGAIACLVAFVVYLALLVAPHFGPSSEIERSKRVVEQLGSRVESSFDWLEKYPIEEFEPPTQSFWNRSWRWYYTEYDTAKTAAVLLPWVAYVGVMAWLYSLLLAYLRREALLRNLKSTNWRFDVKETRFGNRDLMGVLQPLRLLAKQYIKVLDPDGTVNASAAAGGLLRPSFKQLPIAADYVALIDRRSKRDHLADYNLEVVRTLCNAQLYVETFEFDRKAMTARSQRFGETISLGAFGHRFSNSILLVFCDGELLIEPATGRVVAWAIELSKACETVFITSKIDGERSPVERRLFDIYGLRFLNATPDGIVRMVEHLTKSRRNSATTKTKRGRPVGASGMLAAFMLERPQRWMQRTQPSRADRKWLLEVLRQGLGAAGLRWLAATTIYPELRWPLTLALKSVVQDKREGNPQLGDELIAVARLPWFRMGWMPDWLRTMLQAATADTSRGEARRVVLEALGMGRPRDLGREDLDINLVDQPSDVVGTRIKTDSIMLRYLMPSLMSHQRLFALPKRWARQIARTPLRRFAISCYFGALVAAIGSFVALSVLPIDECDLLAGSTSDRSLIGPGLEAALPRSAWEEREIAACSEATKRDPNNGRFWYNRSRAVANKEFSLKARAADTKAAALSLEYAMIGEKKGYAAAFNRVGYLLIPGAGKMASQIGEESVVHFREAERKGSLDAMANIALYNLNKDPPDPSAYVKKMREYIDAGGTNTFLLARNYRDGKYVDFDPIEYIRLLRLGVSRHDAQSAADLGVEYQNGNYVPRDDEIAVRHFKYAIAWGANSSAGRQLAFAYWNGRGVPTDLLKATYWMIFAAKSGDAEALMKLSEMISQGVAQFKPGFGPDTSFDPTSMLQIAGDHNNAEAQYKLGKLLEGKSKEDPALRDQAIGWYQKSAAGGNKDAKEALNRLKVGDGR